jgi:hypothetical protein
MDAGQGLLLIPVFSILADVRSGDGINDAANHTVRANLRRGGGCRFDERKRTSL